MCRRKDVKELKKSHFTNQLKLKNESVRLFKSCFTI